MQGRKSIRIFFNQIYFRLQFRLKNIHRHGRVSSFYPCGQKESEIHWKFGALNGINKTWYKNGQLWRESPYKNGSPVGIHRIWLEDGRLFREETYHRGKLHGKAVTYRFDTDVGEEINYAAGERHGLEIEFHNQNQRSYERNWVSGLKEGLFKAWDIDGKVLAEGHFEKGKKIGRWSYRRKESDELQVIHYEGGKPKPALLPDEIQNILSRSFPDFEYANATFEQLDSHLADSWPFEPYLTWSDFNGDGHVDFAVKIKYRREDISREEILVFLWEKNSYVQHSVQENSSGGPIFRCSAEWPHYAYPTGETINLNFESLIWLHEKYSSRTYTLYRYEGGQFVSMLAADD